jgi:hypothetical protein
VEDNRSSSQSYYGGSYPTATGPQFDLCDTIDPVVSELNAMSSADAATQLLIHEVSAQRPTP